MEHLRVILARMPSLDERLGAAGLDALWVSKPENVRYLSGFSSPDDGKLLYRPNAPLLYTDARYTVQAAEESRVPQHVARPPATYRHAAPLVQGLRVGIEADHLTLEALEDLRTHWEAELVPVKGLVEGLRLVKSADEIAAIRQAQDIADAALQDALPLLKPGAVERDIATAIEVGMRRRGAHGYSHNFIVASGPRGAMPHGEASDRQLVDGELVTIDIGAVVDGYHSDMTRTYAVGEVDPARHDLYSAVLDAEERAIAAIRPGVRAADLDQLARDFLTERGYGEYFTHSLGHGVGLYIHEGPSLRKGSEDVLEAGMVITVEPGVYVAGQHGARVEDLVLVTADGHEVLSRSPKVRL